MTGLAHKPRAASNRLLKQRGMKCRQWRNRLPYIQLCCLVLTRQHQTMAVTSFSINAKADRSAATVQESRVACLTFLVAEGVDDCDGLHLKRRAAVLAEHGAHCVEHYLGLGQVCCRDLYEDVLSVQADLQYMPLIRTTYVEALYFAEPSRVLQACEVCRNFAVETTSCHAGVLCSCGHLHIRQGLHG